MDELNWTELKWGFFHFYVRLQQAESYFLFWFVVNTNKKTFLLNIEENNFF